MPVKTLQSFLDKEQVKYLTILHSPAYTALEIAECAHVSGKILAKTVIVKKAGKLAMVVLPAHHHIDFKQLHGILGDVHLAKESDFKEACADCELGAVPPFGHLYGMAVFFAKSLLDHEKIVFNAGTLTELIQMQVGDYMRLEGPQLFDDQAISRP